MFRQVISMRWAEGVSDDAKQGYRDALAGLREIPELLALTFGDDAGHFEGNFDLVAVMDFADFASARVYVADPRHQAIASRLVTARIFSAFSPMFPVSVRSSP